MCGRYALGVRAAFVRHQFQRHDMPVDDAQDEDQARESYNFAPGYYGLVYRADVPDTGARTRNAGAEVDEQSSTHISDAADQHATDEGIPSTNKTNYKLQAMKWGLVPFWTKRNPEYSSMLKTINCRDDSLLENRGMWTTMKKGKRCIVVAQGFYEWLKKNGGKEKVPHFTKRKDGQLMCFAGLWDCVQYEGSDEKHFTYTIITTDSNPQLKFLHDRMPVILDSGSDDLFKWLDPSRTEWSKELQSLLKPFKGELECYPVSKDVGKVGNNSPDFMVPVASSDNKQNIANFFANAKPPKKSKQEVNIKTENTDHMALQMDDRRETVDIPRTEDNAPMPVQESTMGTKRSHDDDAEEAEHKALTPLPQSMSPIKKKLRSATTNGSAPKTSPAKSANQRITHFFGT